MSEAPDKQHAPTRKRSVLRSLARISVLFSCVLVAVVISACSLQTTLMFPSWLTGPAQAGPPAGTNVTQLWHEPEENVRVEAWLVLPDGAALNEVAPMPAVIYAHGNGELIDQNMRIARLYNSLGYTVLMPEYRGYGNSGGTPGEATIIPDYIWWLEHLKNTPGIDAGHIIYHGRSMGGGIVTQLAKHEQPAGLVLESTYTSLEDMAARYFFPRSLVKHRMLTKDVLPRINCPVLIMHSVDDEVIPFDHAQHNATLVHDVVFVEGTGSHNAFPQDDQWFLEQLKGIAQRAHAYSSQ